MDWTKDKLGGRENGPKLGDLVDMLDLPSGAPFKEIRMIGPSRRIAKHMLPVFKSDGTAVMKNGQQVKIPKVCLSYNGKTDKFEGHCPYCKIDPDEPRKEVHTNVLDREIQDAEPAKRKPLTDKEKKWIDMDGFECRVKESKTSGAWTPARFFVIKSSIGNKISDFTSLNKRKTKDGTKVFPPQHNKFGFDMSIKFDKNKSGSDMYSVVKGENTELSEEEFDFLLWDIYVEKPEKLEVAEKEAESFAKRMKAGAKRAGGEDDEDANERPKSSKNKRGKAEDDDWSEDEDFEGGGKSSKRRKEEDDEDERPSRGKRRKDDDDDEAPWDEDEKPKSKKRSKNDDDDGDWDDDKPARGRNRRSDDDDDDDDRRSSSKRSSRDDDDDDRGGRSSRRGSSSKRSDDWDDDDEKPAKNKRRRDDDEDDEDDRPRSKKRSRDDDDDDDRRSSKSSKKRSRDDSDDWDDD